MRLMGGHARAHRTQQSDVVSAHASQRYPATIPTNLSAFPSSITAFSASTAFGSGGVTTGTGCGFCASAKNCSRWVTCATILIGSIGYSGWGLRGPRHQNPRSGGPAMGKMTLEDTERGEAMPLAILALLRRMVIDGAATIHSGAMRLYLSRSG